MHAIWWMLTALAVLALGYRYYSAFLAAKVLALDDARKVPSHERNDGQNFHPTNRWVLFGHHFAAISGAGPLIGPVLAAQFGFLPGYLWLLFGVVLAGAVQDFVILVGSVRHQGRGLAEIAHEELGPFLGFLTGLAILFIVVVALAGLGKVVVEALAESSWGVFTIGASIPIALGMGLYIYRIRGGSARGIREASASGVALLLVALMAGKWVQDSALGEVFRLSKTSLTLAIAAYGFLASVLPVWLLLCPRDYLSSYLKIGTIALLVLGIVLVNPVVEMPMVNEIRGKSVVVGSQEFGKVVPGTLFPFVFITIACGAISGFHSLVASGTTPKMIDQETDCRPIGYGAMLMEGLVGITALIAASALPPPDYFAINTDPKIPIVASPASGGRGLAASVGDLARLDGVMTEQDRKALGLRPGEPAVSLADRPGATIKASTALHLSNRALAALGYSVDPASPHASEMSEADFLRMGIPVSDLPALSRAANEVVAARMGGAVSLAVGMARIFSGLPGMKTLLAYWYHFTIMFEALFVLTTIDTGTRIGRFLLQEFGGRAFPRFADPSWLPGAWVSTGFIVGGWAYFLLTGSIQTIWPMFGVANQLLAMTALCIGTTLILKSASRPAYALVTLLPLCFVGTTTTTAGLRAIQEVYLPMTRAQETATVGRVNLLVTSMLLACVLLVLAGCIRRWIQILDQRRHLAHAA
ncbi:MAG: carbon starvation protein A [Myxococcales bacterium]|nr:carbon starvation protein A [Polyangiaceae bacterium]MDW8251081.1 carbon starvation protein A [Myxococcales bacterium]